MSHHNIGKRAFKLARGLGALMIWFALTGAGRGSMPTALASESDNTLLKSVVLQDRLAGDARPMFEMLAPQQTGIDFVNTLDATHPMRYLYHSGTSCGGVTIGDVDGDGRPDVYLANGPAANSPACRRRAR